MVDITLKKVLVRYGSQPEVARATVRLPEMLPRGTEVVVETHRGVELASVLEYIQETYKPKSFADPDAEEEPQTASFEILRLATEDDRRLADQFRGECEGQFNVWIERIRKWDLDLQLIDLEWLLDRSKLILYVLNDRGGECTKMAIYAAAEGFGPVEIQPVDRTGLLVPTTDSSGGCGSCGSGGGCGSSDESADEHSHADEVAIPNVN
ncbi:MAG: PSP1 C-terminal domain-containing protein [Planctomycetaceae bacterium]